ncbi:hypothetical protein [Flexistipes sinusarabici]|uniref:hypothetical protein n=1 Tax=Flexistipes sinusarabici TaxID=2352 RepID=UPI00235594A1|nr:hypothetical protein [Flexistipes sinusarabici]
MSSETKVPVKKISLKEFSEKDLKLRRLFILVDGQKDFDELAESSHFSREECMERLKLLKQKGCIDFEEPGEKETDGSSEDLGAPVECEGFFDCLQKELARQIGPVANAIIRELKEKYTFSTKEDMLKTVERVAEEIEAKKNREIFINNMKEKIFNSMKEEG